MLTQRQLWACAVLLPAIAYLSMSMVIWSTPRSFGGDAIKLLLLSPFVVSPIVAAVPYSIYCVVQGIIQRKEGEFLTHLSRSLACFSFTLLTIVALRSWILHRHQAFVRASEIGDEVVQAISRYRNVKGEYPDHLDQLVPEMIDEIPYTGMMGYPQFDYQKDYQYSWSVPGQYELYIHCPLGLMNWDRFMYWPSEVYPDYIHGNRLERIGRWAYVHE